MERANVLLVDDEARVLNTLDRLLQTDHQTFTADNGQAALDVIRHNHINVVVSDQRMPQMTGVDLLSKVKVLSPNTTRILLTGYSDLNAMVGSINDGEIFRFIQKPWSNQDLRDTVSHGIDISRKLYTADRVPLVNIEGNDAFSGTRVLVIDQTRDAFVLVERVFSRTTSLDFVESIEEARSKMAEMPYSVVVVTLSSDATQELKFLKEIHQRFPLTVPLVVAARSDCKQLIQLINEGRVYRYLMSPIKMGALKINLLSSLRHSLQLQQNPVLADPLGAAQATESPPKGTIDSTEVVAPHPSLLQRLAKIPGLFWIFGSRTKH